MSRVACGRAIRPQATPAQACGDDEVGPAGDAGVTILEAMVAMMLLALLSLCTLPLFVTGMRVATQNATTTTATARISALLEDARAQNTCAAMAALAGTSAGPYTDGDGRSFVVAISVTFSRTPCAAQSTAALTLTANRADGKQLSTASTIVYLSS